MLHVFVKYPSVLYFEINASIAQGKILFYFYVFKILERKLVILTIIYSKKSSDLLLNIRACFHSHDYKVKFLSDVFVPTESFKVDYTTRSEP